MFSKIDWKFNNDQAYNHLRGWRVSASRDLIEAPSLKPLEDHGSIVSRGLRGPPLCWETSVSPSAKVNLSRLVLLVLLKSWNQCLLLMNVLNHFLNALNYNVNHYSLLVWDFFFYLFNKFCILFASLISNSVCPGRNVLFFRLYF